MSAVQASELRPAYRTLNEPTRLLGLSLAGWAWVLVAGGAAYGWLLVSPLGWRLNLSVAVIALGAPLALLVLREQSTVGPGRLLAAVVRWRLRSAVVVAPNDRRAVRRGGVRLHTAPPPPAPEGSDPDLPWVDASAEGEE